MKDPYKTRDQTVEHNKRKWSHQTPNLLEAAKPQTNFTKKIEYIYFNNGRIEDEKSP